MMPKEENFASKTSKKEINGSIFIFDETELQINLHIENTNSFRHYISRSSIGPQSSTNIEQFSRNQIAFFVKLQLYYTSLYI